MRFRGLAAFDLDGTLVDSWRDIHLATSLALEEAGLDLLEPEFVRLRTGFPPDQFFVDVCHEEAIPELVTSFRRHLFDVVGTYSSVYPDVVSALTKLKQEAWALAVASNKPLPLARLALRRAGLASLFDHVSGPGVGLRAKPEPDLLLDCLQATTTCRGVYVGDTSIDVAAAKAAGLTSILRVASLDSGAPSPMEPAADHIVEDLDDIHVWMAQAIQ